jgi:ribonuclease R
MRSVIRSGKRGGKAVQRVRGAEPIPLKKIFPYDEKAITVFGEHCSMAERRADDATREVNAWLKCEYLQDHVGDEFNAVVSAVTSFGLFVELEDLYIEGLVHITALPGDYYNFDASHQRLTGERSGRSFQLGGRVRVQVARVDLDDKKIDLELIDSQPPRKAGARKGGAGKPGGGKSPAGKGGGRKSGSGGGGRGKQGAGGKAPAGKKTAAKGGGTAPAKKSGGKKAAPGGAGKPGSGGDQPKAKSKSSRRRRRR